MMGTEETVVKEEAQPEYVASGRGVTNYSLEKPSNAFSTRTTEFDDALMKHDIITLEQAMMAKGASYDEARRLARQKQQQQQNLPNRTHCNHHKDKNNDTDDTSDDDDDDEDDEFFEKYRAMRLKDWKNESNKDDDSQPLDDLNSASTKCSSSSSGGGGYVHLISRPDWNREVNDASLDGTWVLILLTTTGAGQTSTTNAQHLEACHLLERDIYPALAHRYPSIKFVSIPVHHAISNPWPAHNLPTIFAYQYGKLSSQFIGLQQVFGTTTTTTNNNNNNNKNQPPQIYISIQSVEQNLQNKGILSITNSKKNKNTQQQNNSNNNNSTSKKGSNQKSYYYYNYDNLTNNSSSFTVDKETKSGNSSFHGGMSTFTTQQDRYDDNDSD